MNYKLYWWIRKHFLSCVFFFKKQKFRHMEHKDTQLFSRSLKLSIAKTMLIRLALSSLLVCFIVGLDHVLIANTQIAADIKQLVKKVIQRTRSKGISVSIDETALLSAVNDYVRDNCAECLCNGHDVIEIVGIAMRKLYASADATEYSEERVFEMLLQGYTVEEFRKSELYTKLKVWMENIGFTQQ